MFECLYFGECLNVYIWQFQVELVHSEELLQEALHGSGLYECSHCLARYKYKYTYREFSKKSENKLTFNLI